MENINESLTEGQENVVGSQTTETQVTSENNPEVATQETVQQSKEENAMYAKVRRESEQKARDAVIAEMYGESHGIHTYAEYQAAVKAAEEEEKKNAYVEKGLDEGLAKEFMELKNKVSSYEQEKQAKAQQDFENKVLADCENVIKLAEKDGVKLTVDQLLEAADKDGIVDMNKVYRANFKPEIDMKTLKQNAVKEYIENLKKGNKPIEYGGATATTIVEPPKSLKEARNGALQMLKSMKEN